MAVVVGADGGGGADRQAQGGGGGRSGREGEREPTKAERLLYVAGLDKPPSKPSKKTSDAPVCVAEGTKPVPMGVWWNNHSPNFTRAAEDVHVRYRFDADNADLTAAVEAVKGAAWFAEWHAKATAQAAKQAATKAIPFGRRKCGPGGLAGSRMCGGAKTEASRVMHTSSFEFVELGSARRRAVLLALTPIRQHTSRRIAHALALGETEADSGCFPSRLGIPKTKE